MVFGVRELDFAGRGGGEERSRHVSKMDILKRCQVQHSKFSKKVSKQDHTLNRNILFHRPQQF